MMIVRLSIPLNSLSFTTFLSNVNQTTGSELRIEFTIGEGVHIGEEENHDAVSQ